MLQYGCPAHLMGILHRIVWVYHPGSTMLSLCNGYFTTHAGFVGYLTLDLLGTSARPRIALACKPPWTFFVLPFQKLQFANCNHVLSFPAGHLGATIMVRTLLCRRICLQFGSHIFASTACSIHSGRGERKHDLPDSADERCLWGLLRQLQRPLSPPPVRISPSEALS
jgi:hypothetical protein